uniref:Uncharacterized protein n=1 Tax=Oryza punctata TaxID=4537 RepID=A0A0E0K5V4_ORYPU
MTTSGGRSGILGGGGSSIQARFQHEDEKHSKFKRSFPSRGKASSFPEQRKARGCIGSADAKSL